MGLMDGKVALVTGAGKGIGRACALAFAREGARVLVSDADATTCEDVAKEISAAGGEARSRRCDVTREDEVAELVEACVAAFGRIDCAHNNAGGPVGGGPLHTLSLDNWHATLALNLSSVFYCMKHEIPVMQRQRGGSIVNTASGAGLIAVPMMGHYAAAKHGVLGLTKAAALENARTGVRINAVCPGTIDTPTLRAAIAHQPQMGERWLASQPGGRFGTPEEIAEAVIWLSSDKASFVTGESFVVDGGAVMR
jgi:NAD(P)-dependent dehydrogenase (short-subunit alcohol dehydrogenase family)